MIVHELKCIFIHIPKTAGVSLVHAIMLEVLGNKTTGEISHLPNILKARFQLRGKQKHKQACFYTPNDISEKLWNEYYKFAFIRNPWGRVVSEFHWRHSLPSRRPPIEFKDFIKYCEQRIKDKNNSNNDIYWSHAQTQLSYITNNKGVIILDDVFRFENIHNDIGTISQKLGVSLNLEKYNTSNHKHYQEYYNDETQEMVRQLYHDDIKMFNYTF